MVKRSIQDKHIIILNMYMYMTKVSKYMKQKLIELKGETDKLLLWLQTLMPPITNWQIKQAEYE